MLLDPNRRRGEPELYDIVTDPSENNNLAKSRPEVAAALSAKLKAWNATLPTEYVKTDDRQE